MRQWHWYLGSLPRELAMRKMSSRDFTVRLRAVAWQHKFAVNASTDAEILIDLCKLILKDRRKIKSLILQHCKLLERPQTILLVFWWEHKLCVPIWDQIKSQCTTPQKGQLCREAANCIGINLVRSHRCSPEFPMEMAQCRCNLKQHSLRDRQ